MILFIPGVPSNSNRRGHFSSGKWREVSERARFRRLAAEIARETADLEGWETPAFTRATCRQISPVKRRRDPLGLAERLKGIMDGIVDAKVLPDDDETHLEVVLAASQKGPTAGILIQLDPV